MKIIGVTGGIGAGKSEVLKYLKTAHAAQIEALDTLAGEMILPGGRNYDGYIRLLGNGIVREDGTLDRAKIAERIFSDPALLARINQLVNPAVKEELKAQIQRAEALGVKLFVVESALLFDEHYDAFCDETWYIDADDAIRKMRLKASRGYDDQRISATMKRQMDAETFHKRCTYTIDNGGSFEDTKAQIEERLRCLSNEDQGEL